MLRAVENLRCSNNIEQTGWHLLNLALAVHTYSLEPRIKLLRGRSTFLYEEVCRLLEVFFVGTRWRKKWEISLTFAHTSFTLYALSCRYFHLQRVFFCFRSCTFQRFVDIEVFLKLYLFFSDGWFCAGPSPVYQHHHHSRPYAHIPSSPYDRLGIRSHRPAPYPNPYNKRTDLPNQGKNNF